MQILFFSHTANNPNAGASRVYHLLTDGLRERGHKVRCLHIEEVSFPSKLTFLTKRLFLAQFASKTVERELSRDNYDILMCSNGVLHPLYQKLQGQRKRPLLVQHFHGLSLFDHQAIMTEELRGHAHTSLVYRTVTKRLPPYDDRQGARSSDMLIMQNARDVDFIEEETSIPVINIPLALHPAIADAGSVPLTSAARDPYGLLWFGSWSVRKGCHYLPAAFRRIVAKHPEARLTIGGTCLDTEFIKQKFDPSLRHLISVLPQITLEQHIAEMRRNSIFLFPSLSEGFGLALLEAMGMGMSCVTTETGFAGDYLRDGKNSIVIPSSSSLHLAKGVIELLDNPTLREQVAKNGQQLAQSLTLTRMLDAYDTAFRTGVKIPS